MACSFGYRFLPTEAELVGYYLWNKITGNPFSWEGLMIERNIYGENATPWELFRDDDPHLPWHIVMDCLGKVIHSERVLYVFTRLIRLGKVGTKQKSRVAGCGSWHGNNTWEDVWDGQGNKIGSKKTFKFRHSNKAAASEWIMHEYSIVGCDDYVLCKIKRTESKAKNLEARKWIINITDDGAGVESTGYIDGQRSGKKSKSDLTFYSTATVSHPGIYSEKNEGTRTLEHQEIHHATTETEVGEHHADQTLLGIHCGNAGINGAIYQEIQSPTTIEEASSALGDGDGGIVENHPTMDHHPPTITDLLKIDNVDFAGFLDEYLLDSWR